MTMTGKAPDAVRDMASAWIETHYCSGMTPSTHDLARLIQQQRAAALEAAAAEVDRFMLFGDRMAIVRNWLRDRAAAEGGA